LTTAGDQVLWSVVDTRQPYTPPAFVHEGTVSELTAGSGRGGSLDHLFPTQGHTAIDGFTDPAGITS